MTLYLDVIWLLNWLFDCLLLYWTAIILKRRVAFWRICTGGLIGSLIIVLAFTPYYAMADRFYMKIAFSFLMVLATFGFIRFNLFLKSLATLYFVTFLSGGILLGLHYLFEFQIVSKNPGQYAGINRYGDPVSWIFVMVGFPLALQFSKRTLEGMEMTKLKHEQLVSVTVKISEFEGSFQGLVDSGNQLYDPITRSPVMIISLSGNEAGIPPDMMELFKQPESLLQLEEQPEYTWTGRMRVIPYKVVGHEHQLLTAIKPDFIKITQGGNVYQVKQGLVSFTFQQLSADNGYQSIVHPKMLTGIPVQNAS
ncbi:sigma-E processing peptidase SpoIIGA [Peribacillus sp. NPDC097675]|uniref:sigma-E processing peptidase SpoIIGA n=1 Tax=Peribacillus sp. NPDC097675 TaxID=3390618 RepID=UPI003D034581